MILEPSDNQASRRDLALRSEQGSRVDSENRFTHDRNRDEPRSS